MEFQKQQRFSIRKYAVGVASVLVGVLFSAQVALADTESQLQPPLPQLEQPAMQLESSAAPQQPSDSVPAASAQPSSSQAEGGSLSDPEAGPASPLAKQETAGVEQPLPQLQETAAGTAGSEQAAATAAPTAGPSLDKQPQQSQPLYQDTDAVRVLVKLKEEKDLPADWLETESGRQLRIASRAPIRREVLAELEAQGIRYQKLYEFDLLFNGFALETTYGDAKKIRSLPRVDKIDLSLFHESERSAAPAAAASPQSGSPVKVSEENSLINLQPLWDRGIKGQGQVVAVIDTGIDPSHDIFRLTDISKAKYKSEAELEAVKQKAGIRYGKWYSDKIVYVHNYSDLDEQVKEEDPISHGAHVAGTAVGNASQPSPNGEIIRGVAPEAQLMFLRAFSDTKGGGKVQTFVYTKALEDAVKLGADTVNMSLGTASGAMSDMGDITLQAFELARKAGVTVTVAATNMATNGFWYSKPLASTPDYGMAGSPSINPHALSIASINSLTKHESTAASITVPELAGKAAFDNGKIEMISYVERDSFRTTIPQSYVYVERGGAANYQDSKVDGQVVLTERGGSVSDVDKIKYLKAAGAAGLVFYQTEEQGDRPVKFDIGGLGERFPVGVIGHKFGRELARHAGSYSLHFDIHFKRIPYEQAREMSDFSSWGLSADGDLKPDVTLPGGMIYSSVNNNEYYMDRGTSMAAPHAAGAVALVKQVLQERFPAASPEQLHTLMRQLVMSTAVPHVNSESGTYSSVRQQGAGIMDVTAAAYGDLYLTADGDRSSLTLGNVEDSFRFDVTVHNLSGQDRQLAYRTVVGTDEVADGKMTLRMRELARIEGRETVTVPAYGSKTVTIAVDSSAYREELSRLMKNGYFLEGFVFFRDAASQKELVSLPYIGFKGAFQNLQGIEKSIYDYTESEKPFYYYKDKTDYADDAVPENPERNPDNHFTSLISYVYENGAYETKTLGQDGERFDGSQLYFSPNGDLRFDTVRFKAVMLRNVENVHLAVFKKEDQERLHPVYESGNESHRKTDWSYRRGSRSEIFYDLDWNGTDKDGSRLPDGEYQFVVSYRPAASGALEQELNFSVKIDTTAPQMAAGTAHYDKASRIFRPGSIVESGSGLAGTYLSYQKDGQEVSLEANADGSYTLPADADPSTVRFYVWDKVDNTSEVDMDGRAVSAAADADGAAGSGASAAPATAAAGAGKAAE
ncbi:SGO_0316/SGO_0317 family LPXTG-anchored serine peptidase, partial [Streptococcus sp. DD11]|uniref:SGO_0316/SGO_0317 family LPXTG-anchored serine peptidase n=1 Tax=Streptococcus sp. DD11 TaxID=1777879 RepID=UPI001F49F571